MLITQALVSLQIVLKKKKTRKKKMTGLALTLCLRSFLVNIGNTRIRINCV